ncbi:MAG TPA: cysteine--tRNA ligase, partial [Candidatus Paceibacterota bacterium]
LGKIKEIKEEIIPDEIKQLVIERENARNEKDWAKSDDLRKKINSIGYEIKDTDTGSKISKI